MTEVKQPVPVVLAPDLIVAGLHDPHARKLLNAWRDGVIKLILSRPLLVAYLRALRKAGVPPGVLRVWALWFNQPQRSELIAVDGSVGDNFAAHCSALAKTRNGTPVICWRRPDRPEAADWKTAREFLAVP